MRSSPPQRWRTYYKAVTRPERWNEYLETHDLDLAHEIPGIARFRGSFFYNHWGQAAVFRQIPAEILSFDTLQLPPVLKDVCAYKEGLILVTGPTGSGKSTTLAAMIDYINENFQKHIITVEDPIEFVHPQKRQHHRPPRGGRAQPLICQRPARRDACRPRYSSSSAKCANWKRSSSH